MPLNNGKHIIAVIEGKRCSVVEDNVTEERKNFLVSLLNFNGYEVKVEKNKEGLYLVGVTDVTFNPVIEVYKRRLKTPSGHKVTPAYWLQRSMAETEKEVNYWLK